MHRSVRNGLIVLSSWSAISILGSIAFLMIATGLLEGLVAGLVFGAAFALGGVIPSIFSSLVSLMTKNNIMALAIPLGVVIAFSIPDILFGQSGFEDIGPAVSVFLVAIAGMTLIVSIIVISITDGRKRS